MNQQNINPLTFAEKISLFVSKLDWKTYSILAFIIVLLILLGYYTYKTYIDTKTTFQANREGPAVDLKTANLLLFYVDWCPHCKTAKPEWEKLKEQYEDKTINGYNIVFSEYNCTNETPEIEELMNKYKIEGYPTIKLIKDNQVIEYDAKPTKSTLEEFLNTVL
jgi:thiol-disulfide isomerase/thioredoxin